MCRLLVASYNEGKIKEFKEMFKPLNIEVVSAKELNLADVEETGTTFEENASLKAIEMSKATGLPCIADDSGLCIDTLGGKPGVYSARYAPDRDFDKGMDMILAEMEAAENRDAHFACVLAFAAPDKKVRIFEGIVEGEIMKEKKGQGGFGYDAIFQPKGHDRTFAEMSGEEKSSMSHRGRALQKFLEYIKNEKNS